MKCVCVCVCAHECTLYKEKLWKDTCWFASNDYIREAVEEMKLLIFDTSILFGFLL